MTDSEAFWRKTIENIKMDLPVDGQEPPTIESLKKPKKAKHDPAKQKVTVQKITTRVFIFTDTENRQFASATSQSLQLLGEMSLEEGLKLTKEE